MPKLTLLEITQDILSSLNSDEVTSINDTIEATQVAQEVKTCYYNLIDGKEWPNLLNLFQLTASGDINKPTHMRLPENVMDIKWVKYNKRTSTDTKDKFESVKYMEPEDFLKYVNQRDSSDTTIDTVTDSSNVTLFIKNDVAPSYWTSFDDDYIIFDAYDSAVENTLQTSKTQCYGKTHPSFTLADSFIPDLPVQAFSLLLAEAKAACFIHLKQIGDQKSEQQAASQRRRMSIEKWRANGGIKYPDYGRK